MSPDDEPEGYDPEPAFMADGEVLIFDHREFAEDFDCYATMLRENVLFVLCRKTRKWVPAEGRSMQPDKPSDRLMRVK